MLAVIPDTVILALVNAGILGPVVWFFMHWFSRDRETQAKREQELASTLLAREEKLAEHLRHREDKLAESLQMRELKLDQRHEETIGAIHDLIRISGIEVMTRPRQSERAKRDAEEIMKAANTRKHA